MLVLAKFVMINKASADFFGIRISGTSYSMVVRKKEACMAGTSRSLQVPQKMQPIYNEIVAITNTFCQTHLNQSYADLCCAMAAALSRKRPSPLENGRPKTWAGGIVYAIGQVNFLFDKSTEPFMSSTDLCTRIGVSQGTASGKAKEIREIFDIMPMDPHWCLPELIDSNPMAWMISINGFILDARSASPEIQEAAFQKGLIPYIPYKKNK